MSKQIDQPVEKYDSILGLFAKFFWTLLDNAVLFFAAISILQHKGEILHTADIVFWATAAALIAARYLDIKFWDGLGLPRWLIGENMLSFFCYVQSQYG